MPQKPQITFKIFLFLIFIDLLETFNQFCFKKTALANSSFDIKTFQDIIHFATGVLASPFLWLALVAVLLIFIIWSTILSKIDLSVAVVVNSFSFITIPLVSVVFLHERVSLLRWLGIAIILMGVVLASLNSRPKEHQP